MIRGCMELVYLSDGLIIEADSPFKISDLTFAPHYYSYSPLYHFGTQVIPNYIPFCTTKRHPNHPNSIPVA